MVYIGDNAGFACFGEFDGGFDLGEHGTSFEIAVFFEGFELCGGNLIDGLLGGKAIIQVDIGNGSDGDKNIGMGEFGELFGGEIFIDNSINTFKAFENFGPDDWDAPTTSGDNDGAIFD